MDLIEVQNGLPKTYCASCLCCDEYRILQCHKLRCESLRSIFQNDYLCLCYLCKKLMENAELIIKTVLKNQILLENIQNISDNILENQIHPLYNLNIVSFDAIELSGEETQVPECVSIHKYGAYRDCYVKVEPKCEDETFEDNSEIDFTDNIDFNVEVKQEQCNSKSPVKTEPDCEELDPNVLEREIKKTKVRKRYKKLDKTSYNNISDTFNIESFRITKKQCMDELKLKATEKNYISAQYKCKLCVKSYTFKPSYDKHMELHSEEMGDFECNVCKQRMDSESKLASHKRYHEIRFRCGECGLVRINRSTILDHYMSRHSNDLQFVCKLCHKAFRRSLSLKKHMLTVHKNRERVMCAYCAKTYNSKEVLKSHILIQHPKEVSAVKLKKKWICKDCGKGFRAPSQLKIHSATHSLERNFYCVECDKSFKTENGLKQHLKIAMPHVNYKDLPLICTHCEKRFAIKRDLERHINRIHLNVRPFNCDECDKAYLNSWGLKKHKRETHEGYKCTLKFPCPMCDKVFNRKYILKGHIRTHTGERPYQCSKCPATFSQSGILNTHMKLIHLKLTRDGKPKSAVK